MQLLATSGAVVAAGVVFGVPWEASRALLLPDPPPGFDAASIMDPAEASRFDRFPLYWAGPRVGGLELRGISAGYSAGRPVIAPKGPVCGSRTTTGTTAARRLATARARTAPAGRSS
jgi:hypothetical protein